MSNYSGWMPSQIKIELRRRGARASGQKADLVQKSSGLRLPVDWREIVWRIRSDIIGKREDFRRVDEYCFSIIYYINLLCTFVEKSF